MLRWSMHFYVTGVPRILSWVIFYICMLPPRWSQPVHGHRYLTHNLMISKSTSPTMIFAHNTRLKYILPRHFHMNVGLVSWVWGSMQLSSEGFMLGLMFYSHHPAILHHFIFEHMFCSWSSAGQWRIHMSRGDMCNTCVHSSLSQAHIVFAMSRAQNSCGSTMRKSLVRLKVSPK